MQSVPSEADAFYNNLISRISSSNFCSYSVHVGCDCNVEGEVIDGCAEGRRRNTFRETLLPTTYHNITSTTTSATNLRRCRKNNIMQQSAAALATNHPGN
jgi:microcystin-dependent protein